MMTIWEKSTLHLAVVNATTKNYTDYRFLQQEEQTSFQLLRCFHYGKSSQHKISKIKLRKYGGKKSNIDFIFYAFLRLEIEWCCSMSIVNASSCNNNSVTTYLLDYKKNIRFDFDDELKIGDVRYKHLT